MSAPARTFTDSPGVRSKTALLLGLVGPSSSGKTFSALRLATGMQRVYGGEIFGIDTESGRMNHYSDRFTFRHVPFAAPFGPLDYLAAIHHCVDRGAKVIVIDSMTHEHSGVGGVMDQIEALLDAKCGDNLDARDKNNAYAHKCIKPQRRKLNNEIVQVGSKAAFIFCYRANDVQYPRKLGWTAETTSTLHYEMMQRFLLPPGSAGVPNLSPATEAEKLLVKTPEQFKGWFKAGEQLGEDIGERLARWAAGDAANQSAPVPKSVDDLIAAYCACADAATFDRLEVRRKEVWPKIAKARQPEVKAASDAAASRLVDKPPDAQPDASDAPFGSGDPDAELFNNPATKTH